MSTLSPTDRAAATIALRTLRQSLSDSDRNSLTSEIAAASSAFELSPRERVDLERSLGALTHSVAIRQSEAVKAAAVEVLTSVASRLGMTPDALTKSVASGLKKAIASAEKRRDAADVDAGFQLTGKALVAWDALMGTVGQWEAKSTLSRMLQKAQLDAMLGQTHTGSRHFLLTEPSGDVASWGKSLAQVLHGLTLSKTDGYQQMSASVFHGQNSGEIAKHVDAVFDEAKGGTLFITELGSLTTQGRDSWSSSVYGAIKAKLEDPDYADTCVIFGGTPKAASDFLSVDAELASQFPKQNQIGLTHLTRDQLVEHFVKSLELKGWRLAPDAVDAAREAFARVGHSRAFRNTRFVGDFVEHVLSRAADRISPSRRKKVEPVLAAEDIRLPSNTFYPGAAFDASVTLQEVSEFLTEEVLMQPRAVEAVAEGVIRRMILPPGVEETRKPVHREHLAGSSGVGKSALGKAVAKTYMTPEALAEGQEPPVFKLDLSGIPSLRQYLFGAQQSGAGRVTEAPIFEWMRQNPGGVLLLDEIDKAPDDTFEVLMEIFDGGTFTPSSGHEFDFSNYSIFMTSNHGNELGLHELAEIRERQAAGGYEPKPGEVTGLLAHASKDNVSLGGSLMRTVAIEQSGPGGVSVEPNVASPMVGSAKIGLAYLHKHAEDLGLDPEKLQDKNFLIGAGNASLKKDGPSAGIAFATSLASLASGKTVPANVAMSGELELNGLVTKVTGMRDKLLAAFQGGIDKVIVPKANREEIEELPSALREVLDIVYVETLADVLKAAFEPVTTTQRRKELSTEAYDDIADLRFAAYMERRWPPEFVGRLSSGGHLLFRMLGEEEVSVILHSVAEKERDESLREAGVGIAISPEVVLMLLEDWNTRHGFRGVKRAMIDDVVIPLLARASKSPDRFPPGSLVTAVLTKDGEVDFKVTLDDVSDPLHRRWEVLSEHKDLGLELPKFVGPEPELEPKPTAAEPRNASPAEVRATHRRHEDERPYDGSLYAQAVSTITAKPNQMKKGVDLVDSATSLPAEHLVRLFGVLAVDTALRPGDASEPCRVFLKEFGLDAEADVGAANLHIIVAGLEKLGRPLKGAAARELGEAARNALEQNEAYAQLRSELRNALSARIQDLVAT